MFSLQKYQHVHLLWVKKAVFYFSLKTKSSKCQIFTRTLKKWSQSIALYWQSDTEADTDIMFKKISPPPTVDFLRVGLSRVFNITVILA